MWQLNQEFIKGLLIGFFHEILGEIEIKTSEAGFVVKINCSISVYDLQELERLLNIFYWQKEPRLFEIYPDSDGCLYIQWTLNQPVLNDRNIVGAKFSTLQRSFAGEWVDFGQVDKRELRKSPRTINHPTEEQQ